MYSRKNISQQCKATAYHDTACPVDFVVELLDTPPPEVVLSFLSFGRLQTATTAMISTAPPAR